MFYLILILIILVILYHYSTKNHNYWSKRNVKHEKPIPLFGNHYRNFSGTKSISEIAEELYNKYPNEKVVGYYKWTTPTLIIRDPNIIKHILNTDFDHFYLRGLGRLPDVEPLMSINLFHADGDRWKLLRKRLTPAFTTAKLKNMFPLIVKCADKLQDVAEGIVSRGGEVDARDLMARFTTEFIGACGFGIEMDTINNEHSLFRELGRTMFTPKLKRFLLATLWDIFPILRKYIYVLEPEIEIIMTDIVRSILEQRNHKPSGRNDFVDLLLELKKMGKINGTSIEETNNDGTPKEVEMELDFITIAAQIYIFFAAGFETSSSATSYTLHELAFNLDVQRKIQEEIDKVLLKYNGKLCYNAIAEMSLLDMALKEGMRIFPSLGVLTRVCAKTNTIPGQKVTIDPGVNILIPVRAIQNDEQYFDNPKQFNPERFSPEAEKRQHAYTYLPFGEGPRQCIGARLGQMQSLAGLAALLHRFNVEPAATTQREIRVNPRGNVVQIAQGGLPIKLTRRKAKAL